MQPTSGNEKPNRFQYLTNLNFQQRIVLFILVLVSSGIAVTTIVGIVSRNRVYRLTFAAGQPKGESYTFAQAIKNVVEAEEPNIKIEVRETAGTSENNRLLEANEVQLSASQADVPTGKSTNLVSLLYPDAFQLIVKEKSSIRQFKDLKGKTIALPPKGGQYTSFIDVAAHFGLKPQDFKFVGGNEEDSKRAFLSGEADAIWRVRAIRYKPILDLIQNYPTRMVPVEQAAAMKLKYPAFEAAIIPKGSYKGDPVVPATDLETVFVQRVLLAHKDVDPEVILKITKILYDRRQLIAEAIPNEQADVKSLIAYISRPTDKTGVSAPLHPGAIAYYNRDQPSFIQENADYVALILTVILLLWSWLSELKSWIESQKKDAADIYIGVVLELMNDRTTDINTLQQDLDRVFAKVAKDLVEENISQESFRTFNEAYKNAVEGIERRRANRERELKNVSDLYIREAIDLMQVPIKDSAYNLQKLDEIFKNIATDLVEGLISEESFRTFTEVYKSAREAIARQIPISINEVERVEKRNQYLIHLIEKSDRLDDITEIQEMRAKLIKLQQEISKEVEQNQVSPSSLQLFHLNWQNAMQAIHNRELVLYTRT